MLRIRPKSLRLGNKPRLIEGLVLGSAALAQALLRQPLGNTHNSKPRALTFQCGASALHELVLWIA